MYYHASKLRLRGIKPRLYWAPDVRVWLCDLSHLSRDTETPMAWGLTHEVAYEAWAAALDRMYGPPYQHEAPRMTQ